MHAYYEAIRSRFNQLKVKMFRRLFTGRLESGLTASEVLTLYVVDLLGQPSIKQFADYVGISQSNATYRVGALISKGYLEKAPSEVDRRESHLFTTWKCKRLLKEDTGRAIDIETALRARFTEEQLDTAKEVLEAMLALTDE